MPSTSSNFGSSSKVWKFGGDGTVHSNVVAPSPHGFWAAEFFLEKAQIKFVNAILDKIAKNIRKTN